MGYLYCSIALEQVLADIVAEKGHAYLDYVVERAVRRIGEQSRSAFETVKNQQAKQRLLDHDAATARLGEEALLAVVNSVKKDPTPVQ